MECPAIQHGLNRFLDLDSVESLFWRDAKRESDSMVTSSLAESETVSKSVVVGTSHGKSGSTPVTY